MDFSFVDRNITGELIAFVKKGLYSFYCIADVEYFIGEYWDGYKDIDNSYFDYLIKFKVDYYDLHFEYQKLVKNTDEYDLLGNVPKIFIDFDEKYFASNFQEQELERRVPDGWNGEYRRINNLIPNEFKYWNPFTSEWI